MQLVYTNIILTYLYSCRIDSAFAHGVRQMYYFALLLSLLIALLPNYRLVFTKAVFTQRSLSDITLNQSKVRSDKICVNTLNRIGKPDR